MSVQVAPRREVRSTRSTGVVALAAASTIVLALLAWRSRDWRLFHDGAVMHYLGWIIGQGMTPYRDLFDFNGIGAYALHYLLVTAFGTSDLAWRLYDVAGVVATGACICLLAGWRRDATAGLAGACLFAISHLAEGSWNAGQRDLVLAVLLLASGWCLLRWWQAGRRGSPWWLALAGVLLGLGLTIKPYLAIAAAIYTVLAAGIVLRERRPVPQLTVLPAAAGVLPAVAVLWLALHGALIPFIELMRDYSLPYYGKIAILSGYEFWLPIVRGWSCAVAVRLLIQGTRRPSQVEVLAIAGFLYGTLHYVMQNKGFEYHLTPFHASLGLLLALSLGQGLRDCRTVPTLRAVAAIVLCAVLVVVYAVRADSNFGAPWVAPRLARAEALAGQLQMWVPPGERVQTLDAVYGGAHALLLARRLPATRFLDDVPFFAFDSADPYIAALREQFVAELTAARPAAVVVLAWDGYQRHFPVERVREFPALAAFLDEGYRPVSADADCVVYLRNDLPSAPVAATAAR